MAQHSSTLYNVQGGSPPRTHVRPRNLQTENIIVRVLHVHHAPPSRQKHVQGTPSEQVDANFSSRSPPSGHLCSLHMRSDEEEQRLPRPRVLVLGSGVNGLTAALTLALEGFAPRIVSADPPFETVSVGAGAIWEYPPFAATPEELACRLALASRPFLDALSRSGSSTGVVMRRSHYAWRSPPPHVAAPAWRSVVSDFAAGVDPIYSEELRGGHSHRVPVLFMRAYLAWLLGACATAGVEFLPLRRLRSVRDVEAAAREAGGGAEGDGSTLTLVVNCLGMGSGEVFGDASMLPIKGQLVYLHAPHVTDCYDDSDCPDGLTYVVPQSGGVLACAGAAIEGDGDPEPDAALERAILARCRRSFPSLAAAPVVGRWAGLRPGRRGGIRIEPETTPGGVSVLHCYGHAGSGVILSWGSAMRVCELAVAAARAAGAELWPRAPPPELSGFERLKRLSAAAFRNEAVPPGGHREEALPMSHSKL